MTTWTEAQIDRHLHLWEHRHGPDSPEAGIVRQLRAERDEARGALEGHRDRLHVMHRRSQKAEGKLTRVLWWVKAGVSYRKNEAIRTGIWPRSVPHWYLTDALSEVKETPHE